MGLDMYASKVKPVGEFKLEKSVDFDFGKDDKVEEFFYWRKHHDLHGWFAKLYQEKGGSNFDFNCSTVELTNEDLDELEVDLNSHKLPETVGFCFGNNPPDDYSLAQDMEFIKLSREAIAQGNLVFYHAWY